MSAVAEQWVAPDNPLVERLDRLRVHPTTPVIFEATGDLPTRKLPPGIYSLAHEGALPERFHLVGVSRRDMPRGDFRGLAQDSIRRFSRRQALDGFDHATGARLTRSFASTTTWARRPRTTRWHSAHISSTAVRARCSAGGIGGDDVSGCLQGPRVSRDHDTKTYAALPLGVQNRRWAGVPSYLCTGKRPARKVTELGLRRGSRTAPTGAMIAAATTSPPQAPHGERHRDYRYRGIGDSTFMLSGQYALRLDWEANEPFYFIVIADVAGAHEEIQVMYDIPDERRREEFTLDRLERYEGAIAQHQPLAWHRREARV